MRNKNTSPSSIGILEHSEKARVFKKTKTKNEEIE
jgi:hypothetical protein